jgi:hypothetical protein
MRLKQPIALLGVYPIRIPNLRGESLGLIAVDQGAWRLKGRRMCTSHRLDRMTSNAASSRFDNLRESGHGIREVGKGMTKF